MDGNEPAWVAVILAWSSYQLTSYFTQDIGAMHVLSTRLHNIATQAQAQAEHNL